MGKSSSERRSAAQIDADRTAAARLYARGLTIREISNRLEIPHSTVGRDLDMVRSEWAEKSKADRAQVLSDELIKIAELERTAWEAWEASQAPAESQTTSMDNAIAALADAMEAPMGPGRRVKSVLRKSSRDGNPVLLKLAFECIRQRCLLLGLAPKDSIDSVVAQKMEAEWDSIVGIMRENLPPSLLPTVFEALQKSVAALPPAPAPGS